MKLTVNISLNPENEKEREGNPSAYQNVSYSLDGFPKDIKLDDLQEIVYEWIKDKKKSK